MTKTKVFISWSGQPSKDIALEINYWLPRVCQNVETFMSSESIDKGARWFEEIGKSLDECGIGVVVVTKSNISSPWLNFEAGALAKFLSGSRVIPFLFDVLPSEITGSPLVNFQCAAFSKEEVEKLVKSVNAQGGEFRVSDDILKDQFEIWWPKLEEKVAKVMASLVPTTGNAVSTPPESKLNDALEELLVLTRNLVKQTGSPDAILPPAYLQHVFERYAAGGWSRPIPIERLLRTWRSVNGVALRRLAEVTTDGPTMEAARSYLEEVDSKLRYLMRTMQDGMPPEFFDREFRQVFSEEYRRTIARSGDSLSTLRGRASAQVRTEQVSKGEDSPSEEDRNA